ncbi:MAG TPA: ABC transporter permease [Candidatus Sulfotelmatobacter sp.]|nr:ABC transporter permease [Candidatus Sulfotelmatobacter sp.]
MTGSLGQDLRYALRQLRKSPGFTASSVIALALGIGGTTVIFSVVYAALLQPLPYADSQRLVTVHVDDAHKRDSNGRNYFLTTDFLEIQRENHVFDEVIGVHPRDAVLTGTGTPERFDCALVTANTFSALGVPAILGRTPTIEDVRPDSPRVVVLSYKVFERNFGKDPGVVGRTIVLDEQATTVIGVMPPSFAWWNGDIWIPLALDRITGNMYDRTFWLYGRLKPHVSMRKAAADLDVILRHLASSSPQDYPREPSAGLETYADSIVSGFRPTLLLLLAGVSVLLLIACGNVASLLLARATAREREIAIRSVLGASHSRLVRQLLVESAVLSAAGAVGALGLASVATSVASSVIPQGKIPIEAVVRLNLPVFFWTLAVAAVSLVFFGLLPALHTARSDLNEPLKTGAKNLSSSLRGRKLQRVFVISQIAMSVVLALGAGLVVRSFVALREVKLGFDPDHVLSFRIVLPDQQYGTGQQKARFFRSFLPALRALPAVSSVTETSTLPPYGGIPGGVEVRGYPNQNPDGALLFLISDQYFDVLNVPLLEGRPLSEQEIFEERKVAIVNRTFARQYFGATDALGKLVKFRFLEKVPEKIDSWFEVVGVVADQKNQGLQEPAHPAAYIPFTITGFGNRGVLLRLAGDPHALSFSSIQAKLRAIDSSLVTESYGTLREFISITSFSQPRFLLMLLIVFSTTGLKLVSIGVYGIISYTVERQTQEIGLRLALGAQRHEILQRVIGEALALAGAGVIVGMMGGLAVSRTMSSVLYGVRSNDPATFASVLVLVAIVAFLASYIPARRAAKVDPMVALRRE